MPDVDTRQQTTAQPEDRDGDGTGGQGADAGGTLETGETGEPDADDADDAEPPAIEEDLVREELRIDGICGVY